MRKFSILGTVLVAASALTAAALPSKSKSEKPVLDPLQGVVTFDAVGNADCTVAGGEVACQSTEFNTGTATNKGQVAFSVNGTTLADPISKVD